MITKIKQYFKDQKEIIKLRANGLTFEIFIFWFFGWTPFFLIWKLTSLVIKLHDWSAEKANKVEDYLLKRLEESKKVQNGNI